jgi:hypothetical protein
LLGPPQRQQINNQFGRQIALARGWSGARTTIGFGFGLLEIFKFFSFFFLFLFLFLFLFFFFGRGNMAVGGRWYGSRLIACVLALASAIAVARNAGLEAPAPGCALTA